MQILLKWITKMINKKKIKAKQNCQTSPGSSISTVRIFSFVSVLCRCKLNILNKQAIWKRQRLTCKLHFKLHMCSHIQLVFYVAWSPRSPSSVSLSDDLLCLSLSGDLTDGPGAAKDQTVGDPPSLRACPGYKPTMSYAVRSHVDLFQSRQTGSPILLKVPFVLDTLQCETLLHNLGRRNTIWVIIIGYKYNDWSLRTSLQRWLELLWIAVLFHIQVFFPGYLHHLCHYSSL